MLPRRRAWHRRRGVHGLHHSRRDRLCRGRLGSVRPLRDRQAGEQAAGGARARQRRQQRRRQGLGCGRARAAGREARRSARAPSAPASGPRSARTELGKPALGSPGYETLWSEQRALALPRRPAGARRGAGPRTGRQAGAQAAQRACGGQPHARRARRAALLLAADHGRRRARGLPRRRLRARRRQLGAQPGERLLLAQTGS